jgi:hypothetical protein
MIKRYRHWFYDTFRYSGGIILLPMDGRKKLKKKKRLKNRGYYKFTKVAK